jgi:isocitrate dehydrogenase (NAD+)
MSRRVTLIPGDGIGPEVVESARRVVDALKLGITWDECDAGLVALNKVGNSLPEDTLNSVRQNGFALKGPTTTPVGTGHKSANVLMRQALDLYACIRPVKSLPGLKTRYSDVDLIIVRENTEGLYKGLESEIVPGTVISLKVVTAAASQRIAKKAFALATSLQRKRVTTVHKANILKLGDGLFLKCARQAGEASPQIICDDVIIDAMCMKLVTNPNPFDVLLMENLYGDILSDLCAGLVGGLGVVPGANIGDEVGVFEAVHGSAPDIAGTGVANPIAMILSAAMMLEHMHELDCASRVRAAVSKVLELGQIRTPDLGGKSSSLEMTDAIIRAI